MNIKPFCIRMHVDYLSTALSMCVNPCSTMVVAEVPTKIVLASSCSSAYAQFRDIAMYNNNIFVELGKGIGYIAPLRPEPTEAKG